MTETTLIARDGSPEGLWLMEHSSVGGAHYAALRARGVHWVNLVPQEAIEIGCRMLARYLLDQPDLTQEQIVGVLLYAFGGGAEKASGDAA